MLIHLKAPAHSAQALFAFLRTFYQHRYHAQNEKNLSYLMDFADIFPQIL